MTWIPGSPLSLCKLQLGVLNICPWAAPQMMLWRILLAILLARRIWAPLFGSSMIAMLVESCHAVFSFIFRSGNSIHWCSACCLSLDLGLPVLTVREQVIDGLTLYSWLAHSRSCSSLVMTVTCYGVRQSIVCLFHWITAVSVVASCPVSPGPCCGVPGFQEGRALVVVDVYCCDPSDGAPSFTCLTCKKGIAQIRFTCTVFDRSHLTRWIHMTSSHGPIGIWAKKKDMWSGMLPGGAWSGKNKFDYWATRLGLSSSCAWR